MPVDSAASDREEHWRRTRTLMIVHLVVWFIFAFLLHWFASSLNEVSFLHFPLGFYMAAQGSLVVFVLQLVVFVWQQDRIDVDCGMAEDM